MRCIFWIRQADPAYTPEVFTPPKIVLFQITITHLKNTGVTMQVQLQGCANICDLYSFLYTLHGFYLRCLSIKPQNIS